MLHRITTLLLLLIGLPLIAFGIFMTSTSLVQAIIWIAITWTVVGGGILISRR